MNPLQDHAADTPPRTRVGYFLRMYPRFSQTFVVNEILELERQGLELCILAQRRPDEGRFHESVGRVRAAASYLPETFWGTLAKSWQPHAQQLWRAPRAYRRALQRWITRGAVTLQEFGQAALLARWARRHKLRHVHVHFGTGEASVAMLARLLGGPAYSLTLHAFDIFRDRVDRGLLAEKINASDFTVTVCQANRRYLETLPGVDPQRIRVNYNGVDLQTFRADGGPRHPSTCLAVGRLIEKKGFSRLIEAVAQLRNEGLRTRCRIIGQGPDEPRLRAQIARHGLSAAVKLLGAQSQDAVRREMQRATCLVLACQPAADGNVDALPTVLLEAMACGCPVISTTVGGVPEIIDDGVSGRLVPPADVPALTSAIRDVLINPALTARLAHGGRQRVEEPIVRSTPRSFQEQPEGLLSVNGP